MKKPPPTPYWTPAARDDAASSPGWRRGDCVARLHAGGKWLAVVFKDPEGYWFRGGSDGRDVSKPAVFYGPYATEGEAKTAASLMLRLIGELK